MRKNKGFSLIELSIVMVISGFIMSGILQYYTIQMQKQRYETTRKNMQLVRNALTLYATNHNALPCPDNPLSLVMAPKLTMGRDEVADAKSENANACSADATLPHGLQVFNAPDTIDPTKQGSTQQIVSGILPLRELRLNAETTRDGWGNLFSYSVVRKLTFPESMRGNPPGAISVQDETGKSLVKPANSGRYVVISHGPSGKGAWTPDGRQIPCGKGTLDMQNCDGDNVYVVAPFSTAKGIHFFDDFVVHDESDATGTLIDKVVICNAKRKFYAPSEPNADPDGCKGFENMWQGACLQPQTLSPDAKKFAMHPPIPLLPPAVTTNNKCGCNPGYDVKEIGAWDDKIRTPMAGAYDPWKSAPAGSTDPAVAEIMAVPLSPGTETTRATAIQWYTRTTLYTCVQQQ